MVNLMLWAMIFVLSEDEEYLVFFMCVNISQMNKIVIVGNQIRDSSQTHWDPWICLPVETIHKWLKWVIPGSLAFLSCHVTME